MIAAYVYRRSCMPDPLYSSIEQAIGQPIDPRSFERCAVDLLREAYYPQLRGTPPNRDAGIDGIAGPDSEPEFILVVTTAQGFERNLRGSVRRYVDAGGLCRAVVFATSREVSGERRLKLIEELARRWGVRLRAVHDRDEFVRLLYHNPRSRKELLDIAGTARALSRLPATRRPTSAIALIGRDDDRERLRGAPGDVVLVGRPGVGKTFLLEQLASEGWCLFDADREVGDLPDAIREMRPERIVIDDAHLGRENRVLDIRRLREEMGADFGIVAVTWPGQVSLVSTLLEGAVRVDVEELDRDQILSIIEEVGVDGPVELQRLLVSQARGRAGLAVTLARACVAGDVSEAVSGDALLEDLVGWYERVLDPDSRYILGALALAGDYGATLGQVREILGIERPKISRLLRGMASGGTIDEVPLADQRLMRVQPESLRYALVHDVFFGAGSLELWSAISCLDHSSIAALPVIGAIQRGASVDPARLLALMDWSDARAATEYALLGSTEFRTAIAQAPRHDRPGIAGAAYRYGTDQKHALETLMQQAIGDQRSEHDAPEHPLRIAASVLQGIETDMQSRQSAVETALEWLDQDRDAEVGVRVLMHAVHPGLRGTSTDPGLGDTMILTEGAVPPPGVEALGRMWGQILDFAELHADLPPAPFLRGLEPWVYPRSLGFGSGPSEEVVEAIHGVATGVLGRLSLIYGDRPGVLRRLDEYAERAGLPVEITVPEGFAAFYPKDWHGAAEEGDPEDWDRRIEEGVALFAERLRGCSNEDVATRIVEADAEAAAAGITFPRQTLQLVQILADGMDEPEGLLATLTQRGASPNLLVPFLDRAAELQRPGWEALIERHLDELDTSGVAIRVALKYPCEDRLKRRAVECASAWPTIVTDLIIRDEIDQATLALLFEAPDASVQRHAAITLGAWTAGRRLAALRPSIRARWRQIIVASPGDSTSFPSVLKRDPELSADWLRAWFRRVGEPNYYESFPRDVEDVIAELPAALRRALLDDIPAGVDRGALRDAIERLVSDDLDVAAALLKRRDIEHIHDAALRNGPSEAWMKRALLALEHGWAPDRIVRPTRPNSLGWSGNLSDVWQRKIDDFERLRVAGGRVDAERRERIISAGVEYFENLRDEEAAEERTKRVYGSGS